MPELKWLQTQIPAAEWEALNNRRKALSVKWADVMKPAVDEYLTKLEENPDMVKALQPQPATPPATSTPKPKAKAKAEAKAPAPAAKPKAKAKKAAKAKAPAVTEEPPPTAEDLAAIQQDEAITLTADPAPEEKEE